MIFLRARLAARFQAGRAPQGDDEFLARCGFTPGEKSAALALAVRRVIGECGAADPAFIRDDDRWPDDLAALDFWDSLDFLHFAFSVERATELRLRRDAWCPIQVE